MLNEILDIVKSVTGEAVDKNADIPADKKNQTVETATEAIVKGFTSNASGLADIFSGKGSSNAIVDSIQSSVVESLTEKVGLNSGVAKSFISAVLPMVISAVSSKFGSGGKDGLDLGSIIGAFADGDSKDGLGGMLGKLGGLFGK